MTWGLAILLGILQGLTEFLPVSSSGHLALFGAWFGLSEPDLAFDVLVHLATLAAVLAYFHRDWLGLGALLLGKTQDDLPKQLPLYLLASMFPAVAVGLFLKDPVAWLHGKPGWVGVFLMLTGLTLLAGFRLRGETRPLNRIGWPTVIAMSLVQAVAILPGISRAGATIMVGLFLGLEREAAARFSFLMVVPVIGGAGLLVLVDLLGRGAEVSASLWLSYGAGFTAAVLSGFFALVFLMRLLRGKRFFWFGFYCLALGSLALLLTAFA